MRKLLFRLSNLLPLTWSICSLFLGFITTLCILKEMILLLKRRMLLRAYPVPLPLPPATCHFHWFKNSKSSSSTIATLPCVRSISFIKSPPSFLIPPGGIFRLYPRRTLLTRYHF